MIQRLSMHENIVAEQVLAIQLRAYALEASLLNYPDLPPLKDSVHTLQHVNETFYGYVKDNELAGVISIEDDQYSYTICRVAVSPKFHRQGIAQDLLNFIQERYSTTLVVTTGVANTPAVRFYEKNGFQEARRFYTPDGLELVTFSK
ncbi:GNAT family N-acetyltransferase [Priestia koreensis]|uniref:GNAT family N-acetyltransferase n=1 Tax=Priestia koreensis TaxID=284581 RepID=UPI00203A65D2|nr:GNAT family N-acetyltransferase [Priestia koreensis]MCM3004245.1 GNAT family N-acetyltransferase [Priestia koreensis]